MKPSFKPLTLLTVWALLSPLMVGCASTKQQTLTTATTTKDNAPIVCAAWPVLSYSAKDDSAETVREIITLNASRATVCPTGAASSEPPFMGYAGYYCGMHDCGIAPAPPPLENAQSSVWIGCPSGKLPEGRTPEALHMFCGWPKPQ